MSDTWEPNPEDLAEVLESRWWREEFTPRDTIKRYPGGRTERVPGGWTHEHCKLCFDAIMPEDPARRFGYRNEEDDWLCESCYGRHVEGRQTLSDDARLRTRESVDEAGRPLFEAIEAGDMAGVLRLLDEGVGLEVRNGVGETPLINAVAAGQREIAAALLERGADLEAVDDYGYNPLLEAVSEFKLDLVRLLLERGANPDARFSSDTTPLGFSLNYDDEPVVAQVRLLLEHGADPNAWQSGWGTLLMRALHEPEAVRLLLRYGAEHGVRDRLGRTALGLAYQDGHLEAAEILEAAGART